MLYALIREGVIAQYMDLPEGEGNVVGPHPTKPYLLPVEDTSPQYDEATETRDGPEITIGETAVTRVWTVRPKNEGEVEALRAAKIRLIRAMFLQKAKAPVEAYGYAWHADDDAVQNIQGIATLILAGIPMDNPRPWTPMGTLTPVEMTHAQIIGLGAVIAQRKDALFIVKKAKEAALAAFTDPAEIAAFDIGTGW